MIYFDNAATTYPKPQSVRVSMNKSFYYSANPGRAGHKMSIMASEKIYECRSKVAAFFNFVDPERVILTPGCTYSLNTVIKGLLKKGDHVVISSLEHNSVLRPLETLKQQGVITYDVAQVFEADDERTIDSFRSKLNDKTKLVVCTHASNVFGVKLPVERICALCHFYGILFCLDVAQSAGVVDTDINNLNADFLCAPGHKGLYGPMGTGMLIINCEEMPLSLVEGGTGSGSSDLLQPQMLPDKFESGTMNLCGIAGLSSGVDFVLKKTPEKIYEHEMKIIKEIYSALKDMDNVEIYTTFPKNETHVPLLSFNIKEYYSEEVAQLLNKNFNIYVRAGLHCSPLAHKYYNTEDKGTVRISPSVFSTVNDAKILINAVYMLSNRKKIFI